MGRTRRERGRDGSGCGPSVVQSVAGEGEDYKPWEEMLCGVTTETSVGSRTAFLQALFAFYLVDPVRQETRIRTSLPEGYFKGAYGDESISFQAL